MNSSLKKDLYFLSALLLLCLALFSFRLGSFGLLDPDEPFYSLTAKEMVLKQDASTPTIFGQPQFEKPIFFYWVMYACFKFFGISETSSRLGPCIAGILTVLITYIWGRALFRRHLPAFISAVVLATALEFIALSRIVLTDMFLCLFVTAALCAFTIAVRLPLYRKQAWLGVFIFCAFGVLTKGPLGVLLPVFGIVAFMVSNNVGAISSINPADRHESPLRKIPWKWGSLIFLVIAAPWYALMTVKYGVNDFLAHFFMHENVRRFFVPEHKSFDTVFFYPVAVWIGFFPWSAFVPAALIYSFRQTLKKRTKDQKIFSFLFLSFVFCFMFFACAKSKLLSYIFPVFPIVALMTGGWFYKAYRAFWAGAKSKLSLNILNFIFSVLAVPILVAVVSVMNAKDAMGITGPILGIALTVTPFYWASFFFFMRKKCKAAFISTVVGSVLFSAIAFGWLLPSVDGFFSTKYEGAIWKKEQAHKPSGFMLGSKLFVRGASYYTDNSNAGVFAEDVRRLFYTNHSIPMISTREELLKIPVSEFPVYCFFRPKELKFLKKIIEGAFTVTTVKSNAERVFIRLDRIS